MSAIWGIISKKGDAEPVGKQMTGSMKKYKIDRFDDVFVDDVYMACGHQYITSESHFDVSPILDCESGIVFAADAFLTNRKHIIELLTGGDHSNVGDAELIYRLYLTKGEKFIDDIRGSFAIAIYDIQLCKLKLYADPMARRYLAYYVDEDMVCFGSVYTPIKACLGEKLRIDDEGIAQLYMDCMPSSFRTPGITVYEGVKHVNCAECVTIDCKKGEKSSSIYYVVGGNVKPLKLKSDDEYKNAFLTAYKQTVQSLLRPDDGTDIAVQLSGGLDSSSVAALAAEELAQDGKNLYGITIVPATDFPAINCKDFLQSERPTVEAQSKKHPNLVTTFLNGDEGCAFTHLKEYQSMFECPVKPAMNIDNICRIYKSASDMNCKLILAGANGNASISYGDIFYYVTEKIKKLQFLKAYKELKAYCKIYNRSRKGFVKEYLCGIWKDLTTKQGLSNFCLLSDEIIEKYNIEKLARERGKARGSGYAQSKQQRYNYIYNPTMFQHIGYYETYSSLLFGTYDVDPTLTVELIEFCLSLPIDCQVKNGRERRTIRDYMKDYLPWCVTSESVGRGVQAADAEFRVNRDWKSIESEVIASLKNEKLLTYFDSEKIKEIIENVSSADGNMDRGVFIKSLACCSLSMYLQLM